MMYGRVGMLPDIVQKESLQNLEVDRVDISEDMDRVNRV